MKFFNTPLKIRTSLFIIGIILISIIFWINNSIINDLRKHAKSQIENIKTELEKNFFFFQIIEALITVSGSF